MKNKIKILAIGLIATGVSSQAQKMKVYQNGSMTEYVTSAVDSVVFEGLSSSQGSSSSQTPNTMTDSRDGKVYKTVVIGTQTWMAENLNYGSYLANNNRSSQYQEGAQKFCYDNNTANCDGEGGLYQWHTAMDFDKSCATASCLSQINATHQGICPVGWHMPKQTEWDALSTALGGTSRAGMKMKNTNFGGDNSSGFSALGAGYRYYFGSFSYRGSGAYFWVVEEYDAGYGRFRYLYSSRGDLRRDLDRKSGGFSVRCVRN
jgi:uncharacterized protein (TIGR02145 family)